MPQNGLYIQLFSIHGLIRGNNPELGRDADTGGQVKYVLELARALARQPEISRVDLFTRLIRDQSRSEDYAREIEPLSEKARIVRIQCGGRKYIRKELLWPHLDEFIDKTLKFIKAGDRLPDICHGHYADGGYIARQLCNIFGAPLIFTGHSMGRHKKNKLLSEGQGEEEINRRYRIDHRIEVEERIIKEADQIITSTNHEIKKQYGLYDNFTAGRFTTIPPGIDIEIFYPYYNTHLDPQSEDEHTRQARNALLQELQRFWTGPEKPFILALCRPDHRKNIAGLVRAYGEDKELQAIANLAIFAGIRKDILSKEDNEREVLTEMLLLMDQYDLYGRMAIPKKHNFSTEVPELYRLCASSKGVFVNPALVEPFGLTLIEAASCGLPIIATNDGGPTDIIGNCRNGVLVDPTEHEVIAAAIKKILINKDIWEEYSCNGINGVQKYYSWDSHCRETIRLFDKVRPEVSGAEMVSNKRTHAIGHRLTSIQKLLITDIDNTLIGDDDAQAELIQILQANREHLGWGVATGRSLDLTVSILKKQNIPIPEIVICSVGTEIYYGSDLIRDKGWQQHLSYKWKPEEIKKALQELLFLKPQEPATQRPFKISYFMEDDPDLLLAVHQALRDRRLHYQLIFSHGRFLDILPHRASKGRAVRYLSYKWEIPLHKIMVCGDSGNDEDMLRGDTCGVVVHSDTKELDHLKGRRRIFFSKEKFAAGIIDGIRRYQFADLH